jgi:nitrate/TMAO reductase-like tetraheme cytochrome c subunit
MKADGCRHCHKVDGWKIVSYDHTPVGFALEGRHASTSCVSCHKLVESVGGVRSLDFSGLSKECLSCHKDIHRGQFEQAVIVDGVEKQLTQCQRCHTPGNWFPDRFDHNRDAEFKLEGAHLKAKCYGCHKKVEEPDNTFVWFKPLDKKCESCHGPTDLKLKAGEK